MNVKPLEEMNTAELVKEAIQLTEEIKGESDAAAAKVDRLTSNTVLLFMNMMETALLQQGQTDDFVEETISKIDEQLENYILGGNDDE